MTYSIVALDPVTGELGIAVQTCWPAVGATVPWVEPGIGAVATQSFTNPDLGPGGLTLLRDGASPAEAVDRLLAADPGADVRQLAIVDAAGRSAAATGERCIPAAGHVCVDGASAQGNMLERAGTWERMLDAFRAASGDLADRLLAALRAGEANGGDIRGRRSAALIVAPGLGTASAGGTTAPRPWARRFDLRVDSAPDPIEALAEALRLSRGYERLAAARVALTAGDPVRAATLMDEAHDLAPDDPQLGLWRALILDAADRGDPDALAHVLAAEPRLAEFARRYAAAGHGGVLTARLEALAPDR